MKKQVQYTIRGIPPDVDSLLRKRAAQRNQSLNRLIVEALTAATIGPTHRADFSDLVGKWTPDPQFDEVLAGQRRVDRSKWK